MSEKRFDVVIPTHNNLPELKRCLAALERQTERRFRAIVCVDGSTDGTLEWLAEAAPSFPLAYRTHPNNEHRGWSATRNLALEPLDAPFVAFFDSDVEPLPDALAEHLALLERERVLSSGGYVYRNAGRNEWAENLLERGVYKYADGDSISPKYFDTANSAMPAEWFGELGGFDERFGLNYGGEDTEFGLRLEARFGKILRVNFAALVEADYNADLDGALRKRRNFGANNFRLILATHPDRRDVYRAGFFLDSALGKVARFALLRSPVARAARGLLRIAPRFAKSPLVNYLSFYNIYRGKRDAERAEAKRRTAPNE